MTRPSRHIDRALIAAGLAMIQEHGVTNLNIRELTRRAGANLGMFHYHFKTKDAFLRVVLQELYEVVFAQLTADLAVEPSAPSLVRLRRALTTLAVFIREHRALVARIVRDLAAGSPVVRDFVKANFPRHIAIIHQLIVEAQAEGAIVVLPIANLIAFIAAPIVVPLLATGLLASVDDPDLAWLRPLLEQQVATDAAIAQRLDWALKGAAP